MKYIRANESPGDHRQFNFLSGNTINIIRANCIIATELRVWCEYTFVKLMSRRFGVIKYNLNLYKYLPVFIICFVRVFTV